MPKEIIRGALRMWVQDGEIIDDPERPQVEVRWTGPDGGGMHVQIVTKVVDAMGNDLPREEIRYPKAEAARDQILAYETQDAMQERALIVGDPPVPMERPDYEAILKDVLDELEHGGICSTRAVIPCTSGYYVDLDRQGLNDLIRAARRARDKSFGKDA